MSKYNVNTVTITPNPNLRQDVRRMVSHYRQENTCVGFHTPDYDPNVVV